MVKAGSAVAKRWKNNWQEPACRGEVEGRRTSAAKSHLVPLSMPNGPVNPLLPCRFRGLPWFGCPPAPPLGRKVKMWSWSRIAPSPATQLLSKVTLTTPWCCSVSWELQPSCPFADPAPWLDCRSHHAPGCPANKRWWQEHGAGWEPGPAGHGRVGDSMA